MGTGDNLLNNYDSQLNPSQLFLSELSVTSRPVWLNTLTRLTPLQPHYQHLKVKPLCALPMYIGAAGCSEVVDRARAQSPAVRARSVL